MTQLHNIKTRPGVFSHYYPGGAPVVDSLVTRDRCEKATIAEPHAEVAKMYHACKMIRGQMPLALEFEVLDLASKLMTSEILFATITSGIVCDTTVDLLFDSFKLAACPKHKRLTSVDILHALAETHEPGSRLRPAVKCYEVSSELNAALESLTNNSLVLNWVRRPDGIRDLLLVMYTLYVGK